MDNFLSMKQWEQFWNHVTSREIEICCRDVECGSCFVIVNFRPHEMMKYYFVT